MILYVFRRLLVSLLATVMSLTVLLWLIFSAIMAWNGASIIDETVVLSYILFKPADLYDKYYETEINASVVGINYTKEFLIKYPGSHYITLELGKNYNKLKGFPSEEFSFVIKIFSGERLLLSSVYSPEDLKKKSWGFTRMGSEYCILEYTLVPYDLPRNKPLVSSVTVLSPDGELNKLYGPIKIGMRKTSDH